MLGFNAAADATEALRSMESDSILLFDQVETIVSANNKANEEARKRVDNICLDKARHAAFLLNGIKPEDVSLTMLEKVCVDTAIEEINLFDDQGYIFASTVTDYIGLNVNDGEQVAFFTPMLKDKDLAMVQELTANTRKGKMMQYASSWLPDGTYWVQIGYTPEEIATLANTHTMSEVFGMLLHDATSIMIAIDPETYAITGSTDQLLKGKTVMSFGLDPAQINTDGKATRFTSSNGMNIYAVYRQSADGTILGRYVEEKDLFANLITTNTRMALYLILVFFVIFMILSAYFDKVIISSLKHINTRLRQIDAGNLSEKVDARSTPEFVELSNYINVMVDHLRSERNAFSKALMTRAEYSYFADLTDNVVRSAPIYRDPEMTIGRANTQYPVNYDTYLDIWHHDHQITPVDEFFDLSSTYCSSLLARYEQGETVVEYEFSFGKETDFRRKTILMDKNNDDHIIATVIISDIDDIRINELTARRSEQERRNLYNAMTNLYSAIIHCDFNTNMAHVIKADERIYDKIPHELTLKQLANDLIYDVADPNQFEDMKRFTDPDTIVERLKHTNSISKEAKGNLLGWVEYYILAFSRDENDNVVEFMLVVRSINEEKERELEMKSSLEEALREARKANAAKTDFLSRMSHDIRTPMNGIIGMTKIAKENRNNPDKLDDCLTKIEMSSDHLLTLINDILELSRIESGKTVLANELTRLKDISDVCVSVLESSVANRKLTTSVSYAPCDVEYVYTDSLRMRQIILNVISNSVKYTPDGGSINLRFENEHIDDKHINARLIVADTGIGMSEEFLKRIYEPFTQEDEHSARSEHKGTGLGMAIVKETMDLFGGSISIESATEKGTTVYLNFPLAIAEVEEKQIAETKPVETDDADLSNLNVLLVEDNELNRIIAEEILSSFGVKIICANDGQEAVDIFTTSPINEYDCILMDIMMPNMNGYEATAAIRAMDRPDAHTVPIIAMSANAFAEDVQKSKEAGMNDHLSKPIEIDKLISTLVRYTRK